jgi:hypothetical protein
VLPGSYAFTWAAYVGYGSKNVVLVRSPYVEGRHLPDPKPADESAKAVTSATKKSYNSASRPTRSIQRTVR